MERQRLNSRKYDVYQVACDEKYLLYKEIYYTLGIGDKVSIEKQNKTLDLKLGNSVLSMGLLRTEAQDTAPQTGLERLPRRGEGGVMTDGSPCTQPGSRNLGRWPLTEGRRPSRGNEWSPSLCVGRRRGPALWSRPVDVHLEYRGPASAFFAVPSALRVGPWGSRRGWRRDAATSSVYCCGRRQCSSVRGCCLWPALVISHWRAGASIAAVGRHGGAELGAVMQALGCSGGTVVAPGPLVLLLPSLALCCPAHLQVSALFSLLLFFPNLCYLSHHLCL